MHSTNKPSKGFILKTSDMEAFLKEGLEFYFDKNQVESDDLNLFQKVTKDYPKYSDKLNNVDNTLRKVSGYSDRLFHALQEWKFNVIDNHELSLLH